MITALVDEWQPQKHTCSQHPGRQIVFVTSNSKAEAAKGGRFCYVLFCSDNVSNTFNTGHDDQSVSNSSMFHTDVYNVYSEQS